MAIAMADCVTIYPKIEWNLAVRAVDGDGDSAVCWGDLLYLNEDSRVLSKTIDKPGQSPFGMALCGFIGDWSEEIPLGETRVVAVRLWSDPIVVAGSGSSPPF